MNANKLLCRLLLLFPVFTLFQSFPLLRWINKALFTKHPYSMYELKICRDYRDGKVTKEELDKCSTCDMNCVINNGLSEASKEQLKHKTGEEIVDADIAQQMETK